MRGSVSGGLLFVFVALVIPSHFTAGNENFVDDVEQNYNERVNRRLAQQIFHFSKSVLFYKAYAYYFGRADVDLPGFSKFFLSLAEEREETAKNLTAIVNERGGHVTFSNVILKQICWDLEEQLKRYPQVCFFVLDSATQHAIQTKLKRRHTPDNESRYQRYVPDFLRNILDYEQKKDVTEKIPSALSAFEDSHALERSTNNILKSLMSFTARFKDPAMRVKLDPFLERQVDIVYNLFNIVTRLSFYKDTDDIALGEYILDSELTYL